MSRRATSEAKRALLFDSASPYRWADLGEILANARQFDTAEYCFRQALAAGPNDPAILCRAANFFFTTGNHPATLRCLSTVLSNPELAQYYLPAFLTLSRMDLPITKTLEGGIGGSRVAAHAYLEFLIQQGQLPEAEAAWKWIVARSLCDDQLAADYVDFLIRKKQPELAAKAWDQVTRGNSPEYLHTNWVFNGGFEFPPRASPLDWHIELTDNVSADRACGTSQQGKCALELAFAGKENVEYHGLGQEAVISPGKWHFEGFIKTSGITTDQGISLRIYDAAQPRNLDIETQSLTGTHDWTKIERIFDVRPPTTLVRIEVVRHASLKIDSKITGRAWLDSIALAPQS